MPHDQVHVTGYVIQRYIVFVFWSPVAKAQTEKNVCFLIMPPRYHLAKWFDSHECAGQYLTDSHVAAFKEHTDTWNEVS